MAKSTKITHTDIIQASVEGVHSAFNKHKKITGGYWLGAAPESYIQAEVANKLYDVCLVTLEDTVESTLKAARVGNISGKRPRGSKKGRFDIVAWRADDHPMAIIEIKKVWHHDSVLRDAIRINQMIQKHGTLSFGLNVVYTSAITEPTIKNRLNANLKKIQAKGINVSLEIKGPIKLEKEFWGIGCFIIRR